MSVAREILELKRQLLQPNISPTEFKRIQVEIGKLKSPGKEVQPIPDPAPEVMELGESDLNNENEVFQEDLSVKAEVLMPGEKDLQSEKEIVEDSVSHCETPRRLISNRVRAEKMKEYIQELEEELAPLLEKQNELLAEEEKEAELEHRGPKTIYDLDPRLWEKIAKKQKRVAGYQKMIKKCLEFPNWI